MPATAYSELQGLIFSGAHFNWNSTDHSNLLLNTSLTIPGSVSLSTSVSKEDTNATGTGSTTDSKEFEFISVYPYDILAVMDGTLQGNIKAGVRWTSGAASGDWIEMTDISVGMSSIDNDGNESTLMEFKYIWSGTKRADSDVNSQNIGTIFWQTVSDAAINSNQRLKFKIKISYSVRNYYGDGLYATVYCDKSSSDLLVTLPFVMG